MVFIKQEKEIYEDTATIQKLCKTKDGRDRYSIYISGIVKRAGWNKGDKIILSCYKLMSGDGKNLRSASQSTNQGMEESVGSPSKATSQTDSSNSDLSEEEESFVSLFNRSPNSDMKKAIKSKGCEQFGEARVEYIIALCKEKSEQDQDA